LVRAGPGLRLWCAVAAAPRPPLLPLWATASAPGRPCGVRCRAEQPLRAQGRVSGRGVPAREARRHRERPTAAPAPPHLPRWKEKARLLRTPLRQGRLFGGTGQRGGVECPAPPELLAHRESGNGGNGSPQPAPVFLLVGRSPETRCRRCRGRVRTVRPCAGEAPPRTSCESARPVARQPAATPTASTAAFPASSAVEARQPERPCPFASRRQAPARLRLPPQVGPQPMHPVYQNISGHSKMCGDIGITPAIYDPALQQPAVVNSQIPEEGAKSIRCIVHWGDLGGQDDTPGQVIAGRRGEGPPGFPGTSLALRSLRPPKYLQAAPRPRERPGSTRAGRLLARRPLPGRMGIPWTPGW
jgi:hypothetical protein